MRGSRILFQGGGVQARQPECSLDFFFVFILVLNLFYSLQRASNGFITEKTILLKDPEGVQLFPGESNFVHGGPNANFYRNPYSLCFSRGGGGSDPLYPLWIRTCFWVSLTCSLHINMFKTL